LDDPLLRASIWTQTAPEILISYHSVVVLVVWSTSLYLLYPVISPSFTNLVTS